MQRPGVNSGIVTKCTYTQVFITLIADIFLNQVRIQRLKTHILLGAARNTQLPKPQYNQLYIISQASQSSSQRCVYIEWNPSTSGLSKRIRFSFGFLVHHILNKRLNLLILSQIQTHVILHYCFILSLNPLTAVIMASLCVHQQFTDQQIWQPICFNA